MWLRVLISAPIVIPASLQDRPLWARFLIAFAGFAAGGFIERGIAKKRPIEILAGIASGVTGLAFVIAHLLANPALVVTQQRREPPVDAAIPVDPPRQRPGTWRGIAIHFNNACAIRDDGTVWCWGQIAGTGSAALAEPTQIANLAHVTSLAVGFWNACALVEKRAWCFGWNTFGDLGVPVAGTSDLRKEAVRVPIDEDLIAIGAGTGHACALAESGTVWCWGSSEHGEIGVPPGHIRAEFSQEPEQYLPPTRVAIPPARAIAVGRHASCAIARDDGGVICWGAPDVDGNGGGKGLEPPTPVTGIRDAIAITVGESSICALPRGAPPICWGLGEVDFASGRQVNARELRTHDELAGAVAVSAGIHHACAIVAGGEARCWGASYQGQLGDGKREGRRRRASSRIRAVTVIGVPPLAQIAAGEIESCGVTPAGALWCWGHDEPRR